MDKLEKGDEIKVTTKEETLYYKVIGQEVTEPTGWSKFIREEENQRLLCVITCAKSKNGD